MKSKKLGLSGKMTRDKFTSVSGTPGKIVREKQALNSEVNDLKKTPASPPEITVVVKKEAKILENHEPIKNKSENKKKTQPKKKWKNDSESSRRLIQERDVYLLGLQDKFPGIFSTEKPRPLKIGIFKEVEAVDETVSKEVRKSTFRLLTNSSAYLSAQVEGAARIDLDGNQAGEVNAREAIWAKKKLEVKIAEVEARKARIKVARARKVRKEDADANKEPNAE